jgi:Fur family zinc uptake transcriptional regulator
LLEEHRPLGAYAILEKLREQGQSAQPPVAYRALDFLIAQGLAHRIESLNAYVACINPTDCALPTFLICTRCERVAETEEKAADAAISRAADRLGFVIEQQLREASGTCPSCTAR